MDIRDIAAASGYGVGTVSRVINDQPNVSERARTKILQVMAEYGYEPNSNARYLKMRSTTPVAAFVMGVGNQLFGDILAPLQARLAADGEELAVTYLDDDASQIKTAIDYQHTRRPRAMIFLGGELTYFRASFSDIDVPSVLVTGSAAELGFSNLSSVTIDNRAAARRVIAHLVEQGHRRIGILGGSLVEGQVGQLRLSGARAELAERGIDFDYARDHEPCAFSEDGGYEATMRLLARTPDLTAIFALGDVIAFGALRALVDRGLAVPRDLSLVGFDDTALSRYAVPRITTIRQDAVQLGTRAAEVLLSAMQGGAAVHEVIDAELVCRESVAPPRP